jgi:hypothetical protein
MILRKYKCEHHFGPDFNGLVCNGRKLCVSIQNSLILDTCEQFKEFAAIGNILRLHAHQRNFVQGAALGLVISTMYNIKLRAGKLLQIAKGIARKCGRCFDVQFIVL